MTLCVFLLFFFWRRYIFHWYHWYNNIVNDLFELGVKNHPKKMNISLTCSIFIHIYNLFQDHFTLDVRFFCCWNSRIRWTLTKPQDFVAAMSMGIHTYTDFGALKSNGLERFDIKIQCIERFDIKIQCLEHVGAPTMILTHLHLGYGRYPQQKPRLFADFVHGERTDDRIAGKMKERFFPRVLQCSAKWQTSQILKRTLR